MFIDKKWCNIWQTLTCNKSHVWASEIASLHKKLKVVLNVNNINVNTQSDDYDELRLIFDVHLNFKCKTITVLVNNNGNNDSILFNHIKKEKTKHRGVDAELDYVVGRINSACDYSFSLFIGDDEKKSSNVEFVAARLNVDKMK